MRALDRIGAGLLAAFLAMVPAAAAGTAQEEPTARATGTQTGLPLPRFVSLKFNKVHLRRGPGRQHRIDWDYVQRQGMPVEIIAEAEHWRRVRDIDAEEGWIHASQLSEQRGVIVTGDKPVLLRRRPDPGGTPVALVDPGVIAQLKTCRQGWCRISLRGYAGWLPRDVLWGLYAQEEGID